MRVQQRKEGTTSFQEGFFKQQPHYRRGRLPLRARMHANAELTLVPRRSERRREDEARLLPIPTRGGREKGRRQPEEEEEEEKKQCIFNKFGEESRQTCPSSNLQSGNPAAVLTGAASTSDLRPDQPGPPSSRPFPNSHNAFA